MAGESNANRLASNCGIIEIGTDEMRRSKHGESTMRLDKWKT